MTSKQALETLLAKIEAGETDHGCFNQDWRGPLSYSGGCGVNAHKAYDGSLDAALALHEAVLPWMYDVRITMSRTGQTTAFSKAVVYHCGTGAEYDAQDTETARALLMADIKALIALETQKAVHPEG